MSNQGMVFVLRDGWHVMWQGRVCSPVWMERGPAEAYLDMLRSGYRKPEYGGSGVSR